MTLIQLFTAIANAIRAKTGSSETIKAEDFPTEIADITTGNLSDEEYAEANNDLDDILENTEVPSGTINITENGEYDVTNYTKADVNIVSEYNAKILTTGVNKQSAYRLITELPIIDTSNMTIFTNFFAYFYNLKEIPLVDTSKATSLQGFCQSCQSIKSIPQFNTINAYGLNNSFNGCTNLENVPILNTNKVNNFSNAFYNCPKLSNDSLNNILQMCINATSYTGTKTLEEIGLTSTQATTCQSLSNYQAFLDAGWTTGY